QHGNPFYQIKAELTEEGVKAVEKNGFFLQPGMPAEVIVKTGRRTLLSYFLKPFDDMLKKAFNED
ncbi:MAG: HlyD family type I secretion periplasmic adaptor subunit, partial [Campylobacter sp.]|nr:HlyD family type I secretion periplasmic adaptor subunit [Campylobacter sp.]